MSVNSILAISPYLEVVVRNVYWRSQFLVRAVNSRRKAKPVDDAKPPPRTSIDRVVENLASRGVGSGDILVVHSAYKAVSGGKKPRYVNEALKALVGDTGTLVMPAIPRFAGAPSGEQWVTGDVSSLVLDYDPETTPAWTGALPTDLLQVPSARRSLHPLNSVVAWGPHADDMLLNNLSGDRPFACGVGSSWSYCSANGAKVAALGVDMTHNLTMIHVAEDMQGERWCVPGWYRDREFRIKTPRGWERHTVRERHPRWGSYHYAERTLDKDLVRQGVLTFEDVDDVPVGLLDARVLVEFLNRRNANGYPYYLVPLRR
jgi:aminoglycoside 3-N-acetyltransferase